MSVEDWHFQPHGGPYSVEELQRRHPEIDEEALRIRRKCVASPLYLAAAILSFAWEKPLLATPSEAHREVERAILDQVNTLYVDSRGTAKTTLLDEVGTVHQFTKYPNDTQLLTHSSATNAKALSGSVRFHLTSNPRYYNLFPEYRLPQNDEGNILGWSVPCRTRGGREDSVEVSTPGTATAGRHYHVVRCSDWMNENTTPLYGLASLEMMNALVALFSQVEGLMLGKEVCERSHYTIDSNRWHDGDLAGTLLRRDKDKGSIRKIIRGVTGESGNFVSSWPEIQTAAMIQAKYDSPAMTPEMFAANYRSDPLPDGGKAFKKEWLHQFGGFKCGTCFKLHPVPDGLEIAITCDPAFTDGTTQTAKVKKSDRSALVVTGVAPKTGHLYVLETRAGRWTPDEFTEELWKLCCFWKPGWVGIEDQGGTRALKAILFSRMARLKQFVNYHDLKHGSKSKENRISPLHAHAQHFGIFVREEQTELVEELIRFGVAEHDDLADALAYRALEMYSLPTGPAAAEDESKPKRRLSDVLPSEALALCETPVIVPRFQWQPAFAEKAN